MWLNRLCPNKVPVVIDIKNEDIQYQKKITFL